MTPYRSLFVLILGLWMGTNLRGFAEEAKSEPASLETRVGRLEKLVEIMEQDQERFMKIAQQILQGGRGPTPAKETASPARRRLPPAKEASGEFGGHGYRFVAVPRNWKDADAAARQEGGHLAVIRSREEQEFAESLLKEAASGTIPPTWIGLIKKDDSEWEWINGEKPDFFYWREGEPNNAKGNQDRAHLGFAGGGKWNDNQSDSLMYFLIEFP